MGRHLIQGRTITTPVRVRNARLGTAVYLVRADAARAVIAYSGLDVTEPFPGKAVCALLFVDYLDSDLDAYQEFGVVFLIRPPGVPRPPGPRRHGLFTGLSDLLRAGTGAFVHWLPVDQGFTLEAGQQIWGFPKELADIDLRLVSRYKRCVLRRDGRLVLDLLLKPGVPLPPIGKISPFDVYTHRDGVTRRATWVMAPRGVRVRPGGSLVRLGAHPVVKELSELGLPKHALVTASVARLSMVIGPAVEVPGTL